MDIGRYKPTGFGKARKTAGRHGYVAYFPNPIPRTIDLPSKIVFKLAEAEGALGQLAGVGRLLPNPELLIQPYLLREALSSTRIEGTQASIADVFETDAAGEPPNPDVEEVINYIQAMRTGIERLEKLPISTRLLRQIHGDLMQGVRGKDLAPGELRTSQNWIGKPGATIESAAFVPPPPEELGALLKDWEQFANEEAGMPVLVHDALLHAQFETIHPFLDGNGRLGRLMIVFFLIARGKLPAPMLYLSAHLEGHRDLYYGALQAIREEGDPVSWMDLFLTGVEYQANDAVRRAHRILELREKYRESAGATQSPNAIALVDLICANPIVTTRAVEQRLGVTRPTASRLLKRMEEQLVLEPAEAGARGQRRYVAREMLDLVSGDADE